MKLRVRSGFAGSPGGCASSVRNKCAHLCRILVADGQFDAGDHIHTPWLKHRDSFGYIVRGEAAGGYKLMVEVGIVEEGGGGELPVEGDAGSADGRGGAGVHQERVDVSVGSESGGLRGNSRVEVKRLQDAETGTELAAQLSPNVPVGCKLQLNAGEIAGTDDCFDLFKGCVDEDSNFLDCCGQLRNESGDLLVSDPTRAWREDKSEGIGPGFSGELASSNEVLPQILIQRLIG